MSEMGLCRAMLENLEKQVPMTVNLSTWIVEQMALLDYLDGQTPTVNKPVYTKAEIIAILDAILVGYDSQREMAREMGVSAPYLNDVMRGRRDPGPKILAYLDMEKVQSKACYASRS